ncbi:hypothetical protein DP42_4973 [Burkholderia pseudomallei]|nr:hypothetical protein DP42_4973 [Burkholderia pseudomallei]
MCYRCSLALGGRLVAASPISPAQAGFIICAGCASKPMRLFGRWR